MLTCFCALRHREEFSTWRFTHITFIHSLPALLLSLLNDIPHALLCVLCGQFFAFHINSIQSLRLCAKTFPFQFFS